MGIVPIGITKSATATTYERVPLSGQAGLDTISELCEFTAPRPSEFRAEVASVPVGVVTFDDFSATPHRCHRSSALLASAPWDAVRVTYFFDGVFRARQGTSSSTFAKGEVALLRTSREFGYVTNDRARAISISIPGDLLRGEIKLIEPLLAAPLRSEPVVGALGEFVKSLGAAGPPPDGTPAGDFVALAIVDLTRALVASQVGAILAPQDAESGFRIRVRDYIVRHLSDPDLNPSTIARAFGVKIRYLHALFEAEEESVGQFVRKLRVERVARSLSESDQPVGYLFEGIGFTSLDSAQRAFRASTGMSASEYRALHREREQA